MSSSFWRIAISALCPYTTLFRSKQLGYLSRDNFSRGAYMYAQDMPNVVVYPCPLPVQPTYVTQYGVYQPRSEERRVGKEGRARWAAGPLREKMASNRGTYVRRA